MMLLSKAAEGEMKLLVQLFQVEAHQVAHLHVLEVMPGSFIPRVEIGGVARQRLKPYLAPSFGYEFLHLCPTVNGRTVPDHQQSLPCYALQVYKEFDAVKPVQRILPRQGIDF